jgi:hypothetical protein
MTLQVEQERAQALHPPTPATLVNPMRLPGGAFQFTVRHLVVGTTYSIPSSTNLMDWTTMSTNVACSSVKDHAATAAARAGQRADLSWHLP